MTTAAPGTILADALAYAAHGWPVIALHSLAQDGGCTCKMGLHCGSIGKHPHFDEELSPSGAHRGTTDAATILMWWDMWPSANVGIATGGRSGLLVLDVDGATGEASLQNLVNTYGPLPRTIESITGSGGRHILFSYPGYHSSNTAGILAPALDIRCCGGIFVAAPSLHRSGRRYEWEALHHPDDITTEAAPEWLLALLKPAPRPKSPFVAAAAGNRYPAPDVLPARSVAKVNAGEGRDNTGLWLACQMRDAGYAQSEAEAVLYEYGDDVPDSDSRGRHDPYDEADARRNARSAFSRPARAPWSGGHNPGEQRNGDGIAGEAPPPPEGPSPVNPEASATPAQGTETTELANAERFIHQHGADVRFVPAWKCWVVWDGTRWQRDELRLVRELAIKTVRSIYGEAAAAAEEAGAAALGSGGALIGAKHEVDEKWKHADALARWAKQSETDAKINAMLSLAEALPGVAVSPVVFDADEFGIASCAAP
ncbi:MAG: bifunctional DNA primase/polymerase [Chloroflexi bacterium]|nr:bifunctional DNA primase/polymerase [Chloroflexota bacterium]